MKTCAVCGILFEPWSPRRSQSTCNLTKCRNRWQYLRIKGTPHFLELCRINGAKYRRRYPEKKKARAAAWAAKKGREYLRKCNNEWRRKNPEVARVHSTRQYREMAKRDTDFSIRRTAYLRRKLRGLPSDTLDLMVKWYFNEWRLNGNRKIRL